MDSPTKNDIHFVIDCTDKRNEFLFEALKNDGYAVSKLRSGDRESEFTDSDVPRPVQVFLYAPSAELSESDVSRIPAGSRVFCFRCGAKIAEAFLEKGVELHYYFDDELLAMKNAYLTAEGALAFVILKTDRSVKDMRALVVGGGRVGKSVAKLLHDNRCRVFVATRDPQEYAFASIFSDGVYRFEDFKKHVRAFDLIVNTVPEIVLCGEVLENVKKDCMILDLASKPGGVDNARAARLGLSTAHELGIPGRTAPRSAGLAIKDSVLKILFGDTRGEP